MPTETVLHFDGRAPNGRILAEAINVREYRKTATVLARQAPTAFTIETEEGTMRGEAGDYICVGPAGEAWPVKREIFEATYEELTHG